jgi:cytochrome c oxidase subunit 2
LKFFKTLLLALSSVAVGLAVAIPVLADDSHEQVSLNPAGPPAQHISDLFYIVLIPATLVIILVGGAIIYAAFRFRRRDDAMPRQIGGNNALEFTWTLVPALILLSILGLSIAQMPFLRQSPDDSAMHIRVFAQRFAWSFRYPGLRSEQFGTLYIPAGQVVNLDIDSRDVIHSWSVPRLGGRLDAVPGMQNHTWVEASAPGSYYGQCTELCGVGHATMTVTVIALSPAKFQAWYAKQPKGGSS